MKVRPATASDLDAIVRINADAVGGAHWRREDYAAMLARAGVCLLVVEEDASSPIGFLAARTAADEAEVLSLAVAPARQRRGAGQALLAEAVRLARGHGVARMFLEVRGSNHAARAFYRANRFAETARRANYYQNPTEDAVVLVREISKPN